MYDEVLLNLLNIADQNWKQGELVDSLQAYRQALERSPGNWHAAFQLVWIEAAFGLPARNPLTDLRRPGLPDNASVLLAELADRYEKMRSGEELALLGAVDDWDIKSLKLSAQSGDYSFWEMCAEHATRALQYGLAYWCYQEAAMLKPNLYFDPPIQMRNALMAASEHLAMLRAIDAVEA